MLLIEAQLKPNWSASHDMRCEAASSSCSFYRSPGTGATGAEIEHPQLRS